MPWLWVITTFGVGGGLVMAFWALWQVSQVKRKMDATKAHAEVVARDNARLVTQAALWEEAAFNAQHKEERLRSAIADRVRASGDPARAAELLDGLLEEGWNPVPAPDPVRAKAPADKGEHHD